MGYRASTGHGAVVWAVSRQSFVWSVSLDSKVAADPCAIVRFRSLYEGLSIRELHVKEPVDSVFSDSFSGFGM